MATAGEARAGARARLRRVVAALFARRWTLRAELGALSPLEGLCARCEPPSPAQWKRFLSTRAREPTTEALEADRDALARLVERLQALEARRDDLEKEVDAERVAWVERQQSAVSADARADARRRARDRRISRVANAVTRQRALRTRGLAELHARFGATLSDADANANATVDASMDATLMQCFEDELATETAAARKALASDEARAVREWSEWVDKRVDEETTPTTPTTLASPSWSRAALEARHAALHARVRDVKVEVGETQRMHDDAARRLALGRLRACLQHSAREHARLDAMADALVAADGSDADIDELRREAATYDAIVVGPIRAQYAEALRRAPDGLLSDTEVTARVDIDALAPPDDDPTRTLDAKRDALEQLREAQMALQLAQERWGCDVALVDALANRALVALAAQSARADAAVDADTELEPLARAHANALVLSPTWSEANRRGRWGVDEAVQHVVKWALSTAMTTTGTLGTVKACREHNRSAGHAPLPSLAAAAAVAAAAATRRSAR